MPRIELFPFCYVDELTGKWVKAHYVATREEIERRHAEWEIVGAPEVRDGDPNAGYFSPWRRRPSVPRFRCSVIDPADPYE